MSKHNIKSWDERLDDQIRRRWENYLKRRIDLSIARVNQSFVMAGEGFIVQAVSNSTITATVRFNREMNDDLDLVDGLQIETLFGEFFITNTAQAGEWIDIIIAVDFSYKKTGQGTGGGGGGTGATEAQQVLNLTHVNPNTSVQAAANTCIEAIIKADVQNTGISWIDFGAAAVQNSCVPLDPGEWIKVPITNTNRIYANFEVGGEVVYIAYAT